MERILHALNNGGSLKAVRGNYAQENIMHALRGKDDNATTNIKKIVEAAKGFYKDLCGSRNDSDDHG